MKSRTKKNKKAKILLVFGSGIASSEALYLAMLFSHAGFAVYPILCKSALPWVSEPAIKEITGHTVHTLGTPVDAPKQPKWLKQTHGDYSALVTISLTSKELDSLYEFKPIKLLGEEAMEPSFLMPAFILLSESLYKKGDTGWMSSFCQPYEFFFHKLPETPLEYRTFFQGIFSKLIKYLSTKRQSPNLTFRLHNFLKKIEAKKIMGALRERGVKFIFDEAPLEIFFDEEETFRVKTPKLTYSVEITELAIEVSFDGQKRLFPKLAEYSAYDKFVDFLLVELQRE